MTRDILLTLGVTAGALALFVWNRLRPDVVGLIVMTALILLGLVTVEQGISGFANEATVTVALMLVLSAGLLRTGAIQLLGRAVGRLAGKGEFRLLAVVLATVVPLSAFINNTAAVAIMLPMILGLSRDLTIAPSRLLMPLSFGGQLGGTLTLIGTSTNLLVAGLVLDLGVDRIGLFDITPPALVLTAAGVAYLLTVGRWLTPRREVSEDALDSHRLRDYLTSVVIPPGSALEGTSLQQARFEETYGLKVLRVERSGRFTLPEGKTVLRRGDVLLVRGETPAIARAVDQGELQIRGSRSALGLEGETTALAELMVPYRSPAVGRTLAALRFRDRYGVTALAVQRHGTSPGEHVAKLPLAPGDVLLVAGEEERIEQVHDGGEFAALGAVRLPAHRTGKIRIAVLILAAVVLVAALDLLTILVAALLGVIAMVLTGCITPDEAYEEIDWMVIVLLGSILSLGVAMQQTGAAEFLAHRVLAATRSWGLHGVLASLYLLTTLLTSVISNNAAAVVLAPIAVAIASDLGVSPMPLVVGVMFAASNSFITPIGYQTNTFIYRPGGYRFVDFARVGGPLNLLMLAVATWVIPLFFPG